MSGLPEERVQAALEELLGWPAIARSPQLARFLAYIVNSKLRGEESGIKAYAIAVDVFGRPSTFDPQSDPIVRVQARRLRTLLDQFYDEGRGRAGVQIQLPVGRYVPEFVAFDPANGAPPAAANDVAPRPAEAAMPTQAAAVEAPARGASVPWLKRPAVRLSLLTAFAAAVLAALAVVATQQTQQPATLAEPVPQLPSVLVGSFSNLTGVAALDSLGTKLADGVTAGLRPFEELRVGRAPPPGETAEPLPAGTYLVTGVINAATPGIEVTATVTGEAGETLWTGKFTRPMPAPNDIEAAGSLASTIVREIAPLRGPLHVRGRHWLDAQRRPLPAVNEYVCLLTYRVARETGNSGDISDALACMSALLAQQPDLPTALSSEAWLDMRAIIARMGPGDDLFALLEEPLAQAQRALSLAPQSSMIHEQVGYIFTWRNDFAAAQQQFAEAIRLNPLNTDAWASYAVALSRDDDWMLGRRQAEQAIALTPYPSAWYYYPIAIDAFRQGNDEEALRAALEASRYGKDELGTMVAAAAAFLLGNEEEVDRLTPRILGSEMLRRWGIRPYLEKQLLESQFVDRLVETLSRAGLPRNALTGPF